MSVNTPFVGNFKVLKLLLSSNAPWPIILKLFKLDKSIVVADEFLKAPLPIVWSELGKLIVLIELLPPFALIKAWLPIDVKLEAELKSTFVVLVSWKAPLPIVCKLFKPLKLVIFTLEVLKALLPILVNDEGKEAKVISWELLSCPNPKNALLPIVVNPLVGKVNWVTPPKFAKALAPIVLNWVLVLKSIVVSPVPINALSPIEVILLGKFIVVKELTFWKALAPIEVKLEAPVMFKDVILVSLKALLPIEVKLVKALKLVTEFNPLAPSKALCPILVIWVGRVIVVSLVLPLKALVMLFSLVAWVKSKLVTPLPFKKPWPRVVRALPSVMFCKAVQPLKALGPIEVKEFPFKPLIVVSFVFPWKALASIVLSLVGKVIVVTLGKLERALAVREVMVMEQRLVVKNIF